MPADTADSSTDGRAQGRVVPKYCITCRNRTKAGYEYCGGDRCTYYEEEARRKNAWMSCNHEWEQGGGRGHAGPCDVCTKCRAWTMNGDVQPPGS